ncbi:MAG: prolyl oligopeptidase family serine peptidase [Propionibacteriaceae bacterium]|jgi:dipeptidyl aminopeptidase/acylaminoacyl peptidase|nr:prolyl oligopeptidase family serine peptidase [Propionibacteriaceae bacterium]
MSATTAAPYGSWDSPISIDAVLDGEAKMRNLVADGADLLWLESVPSQDGRTTVRRLRNGVVAEVTPYPIDVVTIVNGYGGGAMHSRGGSVAWVSDQGRSVWLLTPDGVPVQIADGGTKFRYADIRVEPSIPSILAVREESRADAASISTIVSIPWPKKSPSPSQGEVLLQGADFYATPELSQHSKLAWTQWNLPAMPWDACQIGVGELRATSSGHVSVRRLALAAGGPDAGLDGVSAQHPLWLPDGRLLFMSDESGFYNLHMWAGGGAPVQVTREQTDMDEPAWQLGGSRFAALDANHVIVCAYEDGIGYLTGVELSTGTATRLASVSSASNIVATNGHAYALVARPVETPSLAQLNEDGTTTALYRPNKVQISRASTSIPRSLLFTGRHGRAQAWFYPPTNANFTHAPGELPPLIVRSHGGPTAFASNEFSLGIQFWTSRGFAVLNVNYSGSSNFGRAFRNRLNGRWGVVDVDDCAAAVRACIDSGWVDDKRISITGGSAGGYTTLQSLVTTHIYACGVSNYGVADLELLLHDTHKFESRYLDTLVGPYPQRRDIYLERSPIHHLDALLCPMLITQGADDIVVPQIQAIQLSEALLDKGLPVALRIFPGEGHGFKKLETRREALAAELSFYAQLFGFTPADNIPTLTIDNLRPRRVLDDTPND